MTSDVFRAPEEVTSIFVYYMTRWHTTSCFIEMNKNSNQSMF